MRDYARELDVALEAIEYSETGIFGFDLETTGFDPIKDRIEWFSLAVRDADGEVKGWAFPLVGEGALPYTKTLHRLKPLLSMRRYTCAGWNLAFDFKFMLAAMSGLELGCRVADGMNGKMLLEERAKMPGLKETVLADFGYQMQTYDEATGLFGDFEGYSTEDAIWALREVEERVLPHIKAQGLEKLFYDLEGEVTKVVTEMELHGLFIDRDHVERMREVFEKEAIDREAECYELAGERFDIDSPQQVAEILYDRLRIDASGIPVGKSGVSSTAKQWLEILGKEHRIAASILEYRAANKILSTYIRPWLGEWVGVDGRIHAHFLQLGTESGRFSCIRPNLQNIPKNPWSGLRHAISAPTGKVLIQADWSQVELRLMAYMSGDATMLSAYVGSNPRDIHQITLERTGCGSRRNAKAINFGLLYGMGPGRLAERLGVEFEDGERWHKNFFDTYSGINRLRQQVLDVLKKQGYVKSITGRRRRFSKMEIKNLRWLDDVHREAVNFIIQGSAGDLLKIAIRNLSKELTRLRAEDPLWEQVKIVSLIHDEMVVEAPTEIAHQTAELVRYFMENAVTLQTKQGPLSLTADVAIVRSWGESGLDSEVRLKEYESQGMNEDELQFFFPDQDLDELRSLAA